MLKALVIGALALSGAIDPIEESKATSGRIRMSPAPLFPTDQMDWREIKSRSTGSVNVPKVLTLKHSPAWLEEEPLSPANINIKELMTLPPLVTSIVNIDIHLQESFYENLQLYSTHILDFVTNNWLIDNNCNYKQTDTCPDLNLDAFTAKKNEVLSFCVRKSISHEGWRPISEEWSSAPLQINFYGDGSRTITNVKTSGIKGSTGKVTELYDNFEIIYKQKEEK